MANRGFWRAMFAVCWELKIAVKKKYGRGLSIGAAYRPYARQAYFYNLYVKGKGNLAARPGTSNHGLGIAIDLGDTWSRNIIDKMGKPYGFSKAHSDAPSEWWHIKYTESLYNPPKAKESIYKHLTKKEAHNVAMLRSTRKEAKAKGGWEKNPDLLKDAVKYKNRLRELIDRIDHTDLNKLNRRTRLKVLRDTVKG